MWMYEDSPLEIIPEGAVGFVYCITNTLTGKRYIGKKLFSFMRSKKVKGKRNRVRTVKESDWRGYFGSNKTLAEDVATYGESAFSRNILHICYSKGECSYYEAMHQFAHRVLENPDLWYNEWIQCKIHRKHVAAGLDKRINLK